MHVSTDTDILTRFLIENAGVRGALVHLDETWEHIRERAKQSIDESFPVAAFELLAEASVASALFTSHTKVTGRLSIQLRSESTLKTLFAECTAEGTLRAIVQLGDTPALVSRDLRELGENALLAITIENSGLQGQEPMRYQGLVALQSDTLSGAFEDYFRQSEQLPTRLILAVNGHRAAGLMVQKLPGDSGDQDGWDRVSALFETVTDVELLEVPTLQLLQRLFHTDGARVLETKRLHFACSCSRERVSAMLESLGEAEAMAAAAEREGEAEIRCEFCGQRYHFTVVQLHALFAESVAPVPPPSRIQ